MATIRASTEERVFTATKWLGLNQAGDGDTNLKMGEAAEMVNFRITPDGKLKKRPGMKPAVNFYNYSDISNVWNGYVAGNKVTAVATKPRFHVYSDENGFYPVYSALADFSVTQFFGFENKLYMFCDDNKYRVYDGTSLHEVEGYVPVIVTNCNPSSGSGQQLQQINKLTAKRRVWYTPNDHTLGYFLPEDVRIVSASAKNRLTGETIPISGVSHGGVNFQTAVGNLGENTLEIEYEVETSDRSAVESMRYAEIYNGSTDNRVFIYGDGTNRALYSGLDYNGKQRADYFPDMNVIDIGDENTPITQMIRHYSRLIVFKTSSAYSVQYGLVSTADGQTIPAFYWNTVNRAVGNDAPGTVQLVENNPLTLFQGSIYSWSNNSTYSSNLTVDERQAKRISEKVWRTLESMDLKNAYCFDDEARNEWYCIVGDKAIVYAYGLGDVWFYYEDFPIIRMVTIEGELYGIRRVKKGDGTPTFQFVHISDNYRNDCGDAINARWESGNMAFNADYRRKYSAMLWVGLVPLTNTELTVTVQTDRKTDFAKKLITRNTATFAHADFGNWSFKTQRTPKMQRLKLKAKKFTYYKLILTNDSDTSTAEVSSADIRVRYTGYVR